MDATAPNESQKPGRQDGPGIGRHDGERGQREDPRRRAVAVREHARRHRRQHDQRALRGDRIAGHQGVGERHRDARHDGGLARGHSQGQRGHAHPCEVRKREAERAEHRDVQPGDAHQVPDPGAPEGFPVRIGDGVLVADRQRHEHTAQPRFAEVREHAFADFPAPPVQRIRPALRALAHTLRAGRGAHVARRANAALERPRLEVEGVRIREPARTFQAHGKPPALARDHLRRRDVAVAVLLDVPGKGDERRKRRARRGARRIPRFHLEEEPRPRLGPLR